MKKYLIIFCSYITFQLNVIAVFGSPVVENLTVTDITHQYAKFNAEITSQGSGYITERGFVLWIADGSDRTTESAGVTKIFDEGSPYLNIGAYSKNTMGLSPNVEYSVRAYAKNEEDNLAHTPRIDFWSLARTPGEPIITNPNDGSTLYITIDANGNSASTEFAINVVYNSNSVYLQPDGTFDNTPYWRTAAAWGTTWIENLTTWQPYDFNVKARNGDGVETDYATTTGVPTSYPTVTTIEALNITPFTASIKGNIVNKGAAITTNRGVIYYPYNGNDKEIGGQFVTNIKEDGDFPTGEFTLQIDNLDVNTHYSARAYASHSNGTGYGNRIDFYSAANVPNQPTVSSITSTTADITLDANDNNPSETQYAIFVTPGNKYVQSDGSLNDYADWQTIDAWGTKNVTGLTTGTTYTFQVKARNGDNLETELSSGASVLIGAPQVRIPINTTITQINPGTVNANWSSFAMSSSGNEMLAAVYGGRLYYYTATNSWAQTQPAGNQDRNWATVAISGDGKTMLAGVNDGRLYVFTNGAWTETQPAGNADQVWSSVSISNDGSKMLAAVDNGRLYYYSNGSWSEAQPAGDMNINWSSVAVSADGTKMLAAAYGGRLYLFDNGSWSEIQPAGNQNHNWKTVSLSQDGSTMLAGVYNGNLYLFKNNSWAITYPAGIGNKMWLASVVSLEGNVLFAMTDFGRIYRYSFDTWTETQPAGNQDNYWTSLAINHNGNVMFAGIQDGGIFRSSYSVADEISSTGAKCYGEIVTTGGSNATTRGIIYYLFSDTDLEIGDNSVQNSSENGSFGAQVFTRTLTSLSPNTRYNFRAYAINPAGTIYSKRGDFWTHADVPSAPTIDIISGSLINLTINPNGNSASTLFAIYEETTQKYVQANGSLGNNEVWQTNAQWGTVAIANLSRSIEHSFKVKAMNAEYIETNLSAASTVHLGFPDVILPDVVWRGRLFVLANDNYRYVNAGAISANGTHIVGGVFNGRLRLIKNNGISELRPLGNQDAMWRSVSVSADGSKILAAVDKNRLYLNNNGVWSETQPAGDTDKRWYRTAMSGDGNTLLASVEYGSLYHYTGGNWTEINPSGAVEPEWESLAISNDGSTMVAANYGGRLYKYSNGSWSEIQPAGNQDMSWSSVAISSDGLSIICAVYNGRVYLYQNDSWSEIQPAGDHEKSWTSVAISSDGSSIIAAEYGGRVYLYRNSSWTETRPAGDQDMDWEFVGISADGTKLIAGEEKYIYTADIGIAYYDGAAFGEITNLDGGNATTRGIIHYPYTGTSKIIGDADVTNVSQGGDFSIGQFSRSVFGNPNTRYNFRAYATNPVGTTYSSLGEYWRDANTPGRPDESNVTENSVDLTINTNSNPANVEYVIHERNTDKFVQADGSLGNIEVWRTNAQWGTITITGLLPGISYEFEVKARNSQLKETSYGTASYTVKVWDKPSVDLPAFGSWSQSNPVSSIDRDYSTIARSADGNVILTAVYGGRIYLHRDGGWAQTTPAGSVNKDWQSVAVSKDGSTMLAAIRWGRMYLYSNGAWTETRPAGDKDVDWRAVTMSYDGTKMLAAGDKRLYYYNNGTWTETRPAGDEDLEWECVAVSGDGTKMLAGQDVQGRLYIFNNGSWTETQPVGDEEREWKRVAISSDGSKMLAAEANGRLYLYDNGSWTIQNPAGIVESEWETIAISGDGNTMLAGIYEGALYMYRNGSWGISSSGAGSDKYWAAVSISENGYRMAKAVNGGRIHVINSTGIASAVSTTTATLSGRITDNNYINATVRGFIYYPYTNTAKIIGDNGVLFVNETGDYNPGNYSLGITSLQINSRYNGRAYATNTKGTGYSPVGEFWTAADVPAAPTVNGATGSTLNVTLNNDNNPVYTEYAINVNNTLFVQSNGSLGTLAFWQTKSAWGTKTVNGLLGGTSYTFKVKARNGASLETDYSNETIQSTLAVPTITTQAATSINPTTATGNANITVAGGTITNRGFVVYEYTNTNKHIGEQGVSNISENGSFGTGTYSLSLTGLSANTRYNFRAHALNSTGRGYGTRLDFWSAANVPSAPIVANNSPTSLNVTISPNGNPSTTQFAIRVGTSEYVQANGQVSITAVWQTVSQWGTIEVWGLTTGTTYSFTVKARNGNNTETDFSSATTGVPTAPPTLNRSVSSITTTSASINGNITNTGGTNPTIRGVIYYPYTDTDKVIGDDGVIEDSQSGSFSTGSFSRSISGLSVNTRYNLRAFATNIAGTGYSTRHAFWTLAYIPGTPTISNPSTGTTLQVSIDVNGNPANTQFAIRVVYGSETKYVQTNGSLGNFAVWQTAATWDSPITVTGLTTGTTYTFDVRARNGSNVQTDFGTSASGVPSQLPIVTTQAANEIATTTAIGNGNIIENNEQEITERGIIYWLYSNTDKVIGDEGVTKVEETGNFGTGAFTRTLTGLSVNTQYNARAYATNTIGTGYGSRVDFWTLANVPSTPTVTNPKTGNTLKVTINVNGNPTITEFAIRVVNDSETRYVQSDGSLGNSEVWQTATEWDSPLTITGLTAGTEYTFDVKAKNGGEIETTFSTSEDGTPTALPTVTTQAASNMTPTTATGNGNITSVNGVNASERGIVYWLYNDEDKVIGDEGVTKVEETGTFSTGAFTRSLTGLSVNTQYNARAYAANTEGTGYGSRVDFWTSANVPGKPTVDGVTGNSFDVTIDVNNNPATTEFVIRVKYLDGINTITKYVNSNSGALQDNEDWQVNSNWETTTIPNLEVGKEYTVDVAARNNASPKVQTLFSDNVSVITCKNPTNPGEISGNTTICYNEEVNEFQSVSLPTDFGGTLEYKWQYSTLDPEELDFEESDWVDIEETNSISYQSPNLKVSTWYRCLARVNCKNDWDGAAKSNVIKVTVNDEFTTGEIKTTGETICHNGNPAEIESQTAASGGDETISYQWQSSTTSESTGFTDISGAESSTYDPPTGLTETTWYRRLAKDGTCNTTLTSSTGVWKVTVNDEFTPGEIETTGETICYNTNQATLIGSETASSGGDGSITYSWRSSADNYTDAISGATSATYTPAGPLTATTTYRRYAKDNTCNTTPAQSTGEWTVTVRPQFTTGEIETTGETICYNTNPATLIGSETAASGGDGSITYSWRSSADSYASAISGASSATYTPAGPLTATTTYRRYAKDNTCNTTPAQSTGEWTVTVRPQFTTGEIETTGETICYNTNPATLIGSETAASGGDATITYSWRSSVDNYTDAISGASSATYTPAGPLTATTTYRRYAKDNTCNTTPAQSTGEWTVTVRPEFTAGAISTTGETICYNTNPTTEIGSQTAASGGDGSITYSWRSSADSYASAISGATSETYTPAGPLTTTTTYRRYAKDNTCNTTPAQSTGEWTVTVRPEFTAGAISTTGETICYNTNPATLIGSETAASGGDGSITYSWRSSADNYSDAISGATSETYTPAGPLTATTTYRRYAKDNTCNTTPAQSTGEWTVTVRPQFTTGEIETTGETICYNTNPATLIGSETAASGGDGSITYSWRSSADNYASAINGATSATYTPAGPLTATTTYRRYAKDNTCNTTPAQSTGEWTVTVRPQFTTGEIETDGEKICYNGNPAIIGSQTAASGGDETISYQWQSSTTSESTGFTNISGAESDTYDPPTGLTETTWYRRLAKDGTCNTTLTASTGVWKVTVYDEFTTGEIETDGETICYNGNPSVIGSEDAASGGDGTISYQWQSSTTSESTGFADISGAESATYDPPTGLSETTWYRRLAKDGTCNTTLTASTGVWKVTVYDEFTTGEIETRGETICYSTNPTKEIGSQTAASGGDETISYQWQSSTTSESTGFTDISGAESSTYDPPTGLTETTWYRRLAKDGTCNTTLTASTGVWKVTVVQPTVYVSDDYDNLTDGWDETHFDDLDFVLGLECANLTVILSNYEHTGDLDITGYTLKVGTGMFHLNGNLTGGLIETTDDGIFTQTAVNNTARTFPVTDGENDFTVTITPSSTNGNIGVRLNKDKSNVEGALKNPMTFFDIYGASNLSGTVVLKIEKEAIGNNPIPSNFLMRYWNGTRYVPIPQSKVTVTDKGDYYEITITQFTYFNQTT